MAAVPNGTVSNGESSPRAVDTVIDAGWVIPVAPDETVALERASVVIDNGVILDVLATNEAAQRYRVRDGGVHLQRPSSVVIPGFVNAHTHAGMTFLRGKADDQPLLPWLHDTVWPIEGAFARDPQFCADGTLLACAEMIRGGVTTFADMYLFCDASAPVVRAAGMRAVLGLVMFIFPTAYASGPDGYLQRAEEILAEHKANKKNEGDDLISYAFAPHAPYTVRPDDWAAIHRAATAHGGLKIHTHLHETADEVDASSALDRANPACHLADVAARPFAVLDELGVVDENFVAVHMNHLTDAEIARCAAAGCSVVHCPTSNAKLGSGFCRTVDLHRAGVNVALGTDSASSNNRLDVRAEMNLAALVAKNTARDPTVFPAATVLRMATLNGAKAFGLDARTGSLQPGKQADITIFDVESSAANTPAFDPHAAVVYAADRSDVSDVLVNGKFVLRDKQYTTIDLDDVLKRAKHWKNEILAKFPMTKR